MTEIRISILAGIGFGLFFGLFLAFRFSSDYGIIAGPISGLLFGLGLYFFATSKIVKRQTQIKLDGMTAFHAGGANHFVNGEAVGGKLYLLKDKIAFKSHTFNLQNHELKIPLSDIKGIRFYNTLGVIPNGMEITIEGEQSEKFVVSNRKLWKSEIDKIKN